MTDKDFETMLRFKAGAGIVSLIHWFREYRKELISERDSLIQQLNESTIAIERMNNELMEAKSK